VQRIEHWLGVVPANRLLAVQRLVVGVLGHQHLGQ